jgi:hypothetical protein
MLFSVATGWGPLSSDLLVEGKASRPSFSQLATTHRRDQATIAVGSCYRAWPATPLASLPPGAMSGSTAWPPNAAWRAAIPSASRRCSKHTRRPSNWAASCSARTEPSTAPDVDRGAPSAWAISKPTATPPRGNPRLRVVERRSEEPPLTARIGLRHTTAALSAVRRIAEPKVRIHSPPAASLLRTCRDRQVRSMPAFNLQAAFLLGLLARDMANRLAEGPDMAPLDLERDRCGPIKLVGRLLKDHRAGRPCASTVGVDPLLQMDMDGLCVFATGGGGAGETGEPGTGGSRACASDPFGIRMRTACPTERAESWEETSMNPASCKSARSSERRSL